MQLFVQQVSDADADAELPMPGSASFGKSNSENPIPHLSPANSAALLPMAERAGSGKLGFQKAHSDMPAASPKVHDDQDLAKPHSSMQLSKKSDASSKSKVKFEPTASKTLGVTQWGRSRLGDSHLVSIEESDTADLDENEKAKLTEIFEMFDTSGDGEIDKEELIDWVKSVGMNQDEIDSLLAEIDIRDSDGNACMDVNEFLMLVGASKKKGHGSVIDKLLKHTNSMKAHLGCDAFNRVANFLASTLRDQSKKIGNRNKQGVDDWIQVLLSQSSAIPMTMAKSLREDYVPKIERPQVIPVKCPFGHRLELFLTPSEGWSCNKCHESFPNKYPLNGCRTCNWDMCHDCCIRDYADNEEADAPQKVNTARSDVTSARSSTVPPINTARSDMTSARSSTGPASSTAKSNDDASVGPWQRYSQSMVQPEDGAASNRSKFSSNESASPSISKAEARKLAKGTLSSARSEASLKSCASNRSQAPDQVTSTELPCDSPPPISSLETSPAMPTASRVSQLNASFAGLDVMNAVDAAPKEKVLSPQEEEAIVKIQSLERGRSQRMKSAKLRREKAQRHAAAVKIQKTARGRAARKAVSKKQQKETLHPPSQQVNPGINADMGLEVAGDSKDTSKNLVEILQRLKHKEKGVREKIWKLVGRNKEDTELKQLEEANLVRAALFADFIDALARNVTEKTLNN
eukprot:gnl/MRDRNA2_/MRDRNA2_102571_c0_seq1.p1 gnl/MRDRNA2_/MRDRNA2_102571_c0~~gnl/MRDRNA2_/MRDRNA2_102571_c0_seq1.p1  ORF type:complete len:691 (+),score=143.38 gnl/MRDRNA2_/MRDRNA2_102571_c0_seq1:91-2163(+)